MLRSAWFVARWDLLFLLRQRETILWTFVMPFLFFYFIGTVTAGLGVSGGAGGEAESAGGTSCSARKTSDGRSMKCTAALFSCAHSRAWYSGL